MNPMSRRALLLWTLLGALAPAAGEAARLPSPTTADPVTDLALDGDGVRLALFYCADDVSLNQNPGVVLEWTGSAWATLSSSVTAQCHTPDVVVRGAVVAGSYLTDALDLGAFCLGGACSGGADIDQDGLRSVHAPRIGWAFGFPYATYTQFQGALAQDLLFIDALYPLLDPLADPPETTGAYHCEGSCYELATPTLAGTDDFVFAAYRVPSLDCVAVRWESASGFGHYLCITEFPAPNAIWPEVAVVNGRPVLLWRESHDGTTSILGGEYTGPLDQPGEAGFWRKIEQYDSLGADWDRLRVVSTGTELFALLRRGSELTLRHWNGVDAWTTPWQETVSPYPDVPDLGYRDGNVYVAWRSGSAIEVEEIAVPEPAPGPLGVTSAVLLAAIALRRA
jgi:hypothetical protein